MESGFSSELFWVEWFWIEWFWIEWFTKRLEDVIENSVDLLRPHAFVILSIHNFLKTSHFNLPLHGSSFNKADKI